MPSTSVPPFPPTPARLDARSPFSEPALPQAGESSREALDDLAMEKIVLPFLFAIGFTFFAAFEWWRSVRDAPPQPWTFTLVALGFVAVFVRQVVKYRPALRQLRQGIRGERHVGQMLEDLRRMDYRVFHDLRANSNNSRFNVDHLLIGPAGVLTIETKTITKPMRRGTPTVTFDGQRVLVDGHKPDRDPIGQAEAQASYVRERLLAQTGRRVDVRPVVLYATWFVRMTVRRPRVWVLNEKSLVKFLAKQPRRLNDATIALLSNAVEVELRQTRA